MDDRSPFPHAADLFNGANLEQEILKNCLALGFFKETLKR